MEGRSDVMDLEVASLNTKAGPQECLLRSLAKNVGMAIAEEPTTLPCWLRLYGIPLELWHRSGVHYLASGVGQLLKTDVRSFNSANMCTARIQVECAAKNGLNKTIEAIDSRGNPFTVSVVYETQALCCKGCGVFGHNEESCSKRVKEVVKEGSDDGEYVPNSIIQQNDADDEGSWDLLGGQQELDRMDKLIERLCSNGSKFEEEERGSPVAGRGFPDNWVGRRIDEDDSSGSTRAVIEGGRRGRRKRKENRGSGPCISPQ
ncbi:hypothetical protein MLD38_031264 [Melastoma candidum]|uniref:Uncharacterized protein n=1 Tax=Melastoma candidum TaxID=119954 RepID=A0ACB9MNR9_9MYRT|nr:hypothetical protein MLD38_031264 [Melastoma candidum]